MRKRAWARTHAKQMFRTLTFTLQATWGALDMEKFRFSIDRGGTFTDVYAECPGGKICVLKLLSEDPLNYRDAPTEAIRRVIEQVGQYVEATTLQPVGLLPLAQSA